MQQMIFIAYLIACSTCFGHHYANHQELESIMQVVAACHIWCFGFQVVGMVWNWGLGGLFAGCYVSRTTMPIIRSSRLLYKWLLPVVFGALVWTKAPNTTGSNHLYNTLMMGIVVSETCWASNKIRSKNHLLHLVGILFPHSKPSCFCGSFVM